MTDQRDLNPCGESDQLVVVIEFAKTMLIVAKLKARSKALRQKSKLTL